MSETKLSNQAEPVFVTNTDEARHTEVIPRRQRENFCKTTTGSGRYTNDWITTMKVNRKEFIHNKEEKLLLKQFR